MALALCVLAWLFGIVLALMAVALYFMGGTVQAVLIAVAALLLLPPAWRLLEPIGLAPRGWVRSLGAVLLFGGMIWFTVASPAVTIYKSPEVQARVQALYRDKLAEWPVPVEEIYVSTRYGRIHVLAAGPEDAPPLLLIHASALAAWSWLPNAAALAAGHRIYAPDNLGEIGLNAQTDPNVIPASNAEIAGYYREITEELGIEKTDLVGASIGGFIATTYALEMPERVGRLALLGAMGYGHTDTTIALMMLAQAYPLPFLQDWTMRWALGESPQVAATFGDWFRLVLNGTMPKPIPPRSFTPEQLRQLAVPTLAVFGSKDEVIGPAEKATALAGNIPDVETLVVDSGHLIGAELPDVTNKVLTGFLDSEA